MGMAIWVNADEMIERLKWDFDEEYAKSIVYDATSFCADMVEVVRCEDCKYRHDTCFAGNGNIYCDMKRVYFPLDGYCCYGEKKED